MKYLILLSAYLTACTVNIDSGGDASLSTHSDAGSTYGQPPYEVYIPPKQDPPKQQSTACPLTIPEEGASCGRLDVSTCAKAVGTGKPSFVILSCESSGGMICESCGNCVWKKYDCSKSCGVWEVSKCVVQPLGTADYCDVCK